MKKLLVISLLVVSVSLFAGCGSSDIVSKTVAEEESIAKGRLDEMNATYMGGLYARSETNDMMIAFYKVSDTPIVVVTEFEKMYYGEYITKDVELFDGTKYTAITVQNETYGYHFNDDMTGILVDRDGNKYEAKEIHISVAADMLSEAKKTYEFKGLK